MHSEELEGRFNGWASLLGELLGLSANAKATQKWAEGWNFEELHGEIMPFDDACGKKALKDANVVSWIES